MNGKKRCAKSTVLKQPQPPRVILLEQGESALMEGFHEPEEGVACDVLCRTWTFSQECPAHIECYWNICFLQIGTVAFQGIHGLVQVRQGDVRSLPRLRLNCPHLGYALWVDFWVLWRGWFSGLFSGLLVTIAVWNCKTVRVGVTSQGLERR